VLLIAAGLQVEAPKILATEHLDGGTAKYDGFLIGS
jgi:hypothetical protein